MGLKRIYITLFVFILCFTGWTIISTDCDDGPEIIVSAAISLKDAFDEIGMGFYEEYGVVVNFNYGASGILVQQIMHGAPIDVYVSAGRLHTQELIENKMIFDKSVVFASNELLFLANKKYSNSKSKLADFFVNPKIKLALGNPKIVPAGFYVKQALVEQGLWERVERHVVYGGNVRSVYQYIARGEVDAGFVYSSYTSEKDYGLEILSPDPLDLSHVGIDYYASITVNGKKKGIARQFIEFLSSEKATGALKRNGFKRSKSI